MKHVRVINQAFACLIAVIALLLPDECLAQSFQGSSVVYFPDSSRVLVFGGFSGAATLDTVSSISFANAFDVESPPITRITPALPNAAHSAVPAVRQSPGYSDMWEISLFAGTAVNSTNPSALPIPSGNVITMSTTSSSSNRVLGVRSMPTGTGVTGGDFVSSCVSLSATARPPAAGTVDASVGFAFGGYSRRENATLDSLFALGPDNVLKNIAPPPTSTRPSTPPARASGALTRLNATHLILTGGISSAGTSLRDVWIYDLRTQVWSQYPQALSTARAKHQAVVYSGSNGRDYVILVGGDRSPSMIEYANVAAGQAWFTSSVQGMEVMSTMVNHAVMVIDEKLVVFGASMNPNDPANFLPLSVIKVKVESDNMLTFAWTTSFQPLRSTGPDTPLPPVAEPFINADADGSTASSVIGAGIGIVTVAIIVIGAAFHDRRRLRPTPSSQTDHFSRQEPAAGFCQVPMSDIAPSESASQVGQHGASGGPSNNQQAPSFPPSMPQPTASKVTATQGGLGHANVHHRDAVHETLYLMDKVPPGVTVAPLGDHHG